MSAVTRSSAGEGLLVDTALGLRSRGLRRVVDVLVAATVPAAIAVAGAAGVGAWHLACLAALVGAVALVRVRRVAVRHRAVGAAVTLVVGAQPTLHLVGEMWHGAATGPDAAGAAHVGLLGLHLGLAAVLSAVVVLADVLVLAVAGAVGHVVRMLAARRGAVPARRAEVPVPAEPAGVGHRWPGLAYARRRGPPGTPSFA